MSKHQPYRDADWPQNRQTFRLIEYSKPDSEGRQSLDVLWWDESGRPRAQAFFTRKDELKERFARRLSGGKMSGNGQNSRKEIASQETP